MQPLLPILFSLALHIHWYGGKPLMVSCWDRYPQKKFAVSVKDTISQCSESCKFPRGCDGAVCGGEMAPTHCLCLTLYPGHQDSTARSDPQLLLHCISCLQRAHAGAWVVSRGHAKLLSLPLQMCPLGFLKNYLCKLPVDGPVSMGH